MGIIVIVTILETQKSYINSSKLYNLEKVQRYSGLSDSRASILNLDIRESQTLGDFIG